MEVGGWKIGGRGYGGRGWKIGGRRYGGRGMEDRGQGWR